MSLHLRLAKQHMESVSCLVNGFIKETFNVFTPEIIKYNISLFISYTHSGFMVIKSKNIKNGTRKWFSLHYNFIICKRTPNDINKLACIPLEGCKVSMISYHDKTFQLITSFWCKQTKQLRLKTFIFETPNQSDCLIWYSKIKSASTLGIRDIYRLRYKLGVSHGFNDKHKVFASRNRVLSGEFAVKIINKKNYSEKRCQNDIKLLDLLFKPHPNIIQFKDAFETKKYFCIAMELNQNGLLFDQIKALDIDFYHENLIKNIIKQLVNGIKYLHSHNIVYKNLGANNILSDSSVNTIKIGISNIVGNTNDDNKENVFCSPEIKEDSEYDYRCDYWSLGVIMYILFCGRKPIYDYRRRYGAINLLYHAHPGCDVNTVKFDKYDWKHVSMSVKYLVYGLLRNDPKQRKTDRDIMDTFLAPKNARGLPINEDVKTQGFAKAYTNIKHQIF